MECRLQKSIFYVLIANYYLVYAGEHDPQVSLVESSDFSGVATSIDDLKNEVLTFLQSLNQLNYHFVITPSYLKIENEVKTIVEADEKSYKITNDDKYSTEFENEYGKLVRYASEAMAELEEIIANNSVTISQYKFQRFSKLCNRLRQNFITGQKHIEINEDEKKLNDALERFITTVADVQKEYTEIVTLRTEAEIFLKRVTTAIPALELPNVYHDIRDKVKIMEISEHGFYYIANNVDSEEFKKEYVKLVDYLYAAVDDYIRQIKSKDMKFTRFENSEVLVDARSDFAREMDAVKSEKLEAKLLELSRVMNERTSWSNILTNMTAERERSSGTELKSDQEVKGNANKHSENVHNLENGITNPYLERTSN